MKKNVVQGGLNVRASASYIGVSAPTFLKLIHESKEIPFRRVGKRVVVAKSALDAWLDGAK